MRGYSIVNVDGFALSVPFQLLTCIADRGGGGTSKVGLGPKGLRDGFEPKGPGLVGTVQGRDIPSASFCTVRRVTVWVRVRGDRVRGRIRGRIRGRTRANEV